MSSLLLERADILRAKQAALMCLQEKKVREKEKLTQTMIYGLWQNEQQMQAGLMKLKTKISKLQVLKAQLDLRKVLEQTPVDEYFLLFKKQRKKKTLSVDKICSNLCKLFPPTSGCDNESLIGKRIKHKWNVDETEKWCFGTILNVLAPMISTMQDMMMNQ